MRVKHLIAKLAEYNPDYEIAFVVEEGQDAKILEIKVSDRTQELEIQIGEV